MAITLNADNAQLLYVAYYGRPADNGGLSFWQNALRSNSVSLTGGSPVSQAQTEVFGKILGDFGRSTEASALFSNLSNQEAVNLIYNQLFNRNAVFTLGANGLATGPDAFFFNKLVTGEISLARLALEVALGSQGSDETALNNKVASANLFSNTLLNPTFSNSYVGQNAVNAGRQFVAQFGGNVATQAQVSSAIVNLGIATPLQPTGSDNTNNTLEPILSPQIIAYLSPRLSSQIARKYSPQTTPGVALDFSNTSISTTVRTVSYDPASKTASVNSVFGQTSQLTKTTLVKNKDTFEINSTNSYINTLDPSGNFNNSSKEVFTTNLDTYQSISSLRSIDFAALIDLQSFKTVTNSNGVLSSSYSGNPLSLGRNTTLDNLANNTTNSRITPIGLELSGILLKIYKLPDLNFLIITQLEKNQNTSTTNYSVVSSTGVVFANTQKSNKYYEFINVKYNSQSQQALQGLTGTAVQVPNKDYLVGTTDSDILVGASSSETFIGNGGNDTITTGGGADTVVFNTLSGTSTITDFLSGSTKIALDKSVFTALSSNNVTVGSTPTGSPLVFDKLNNTLYYNAPSQSPFAIATLTGISSISSSDIQLF